MKQQPVGRSWLVGLALAAWLGISATASAKEEFDRFLEALRQSQMHETAMVYLDTMRTSNLLSPADKVRIPFEEGVTLVEQARTINDLPRRTAILDKAAAKFAAFTKENPTHELAASSNSKQGVVMMERGKILVQKAGLDSQKDQRPQLLEQARDIFKEAETTFEGAEALYEEEVKQYPTTPLPPNDPVAVARDTARKNLIRARILTAQIYEQSAYTYEKGTEEFKTALTRALEKYRAVHERYRRWKAGLFATLFMADCFIKLDQPDQAVIYLQEFLIMERPDLRDVRRKALRLALMAWTHEKELKWQEPLKHIDAWFKVATPDEERGPEGLAIHWLAVVVNDIARPQIEDERQKKQMLVDAAKHARFVARFRSEYQKPAKEWIVENDPGQTEIAQTFDDLYDAGRTKLTIAEAEKDAAKGLAVRNEAIDLFMQALDKRTESTHVEQVNQVRYFLVYMFYKNARYYEAAVIGDHVARTYPDGATGRPCAYLSLLSWLQAYRNVKAGTDATFENDHMLATADLMVQKWPGDEKTDTAVMLLVDHFTSKGQFDDAIALLEKIPEDSARRSEADLKAGTTLWNLYLKEVAAKKLAADALADIRKKSEAALSRGIDRMRGDIKGADDVTYTLLAAELSLAQQFLDGSEPANALAMITNRVPKDTGVLAMVWGGKEVTQKGNFPIEALKAALRGFVGTQELDQAQLVMTKLDEVVTASGEADAELALTRIYINLGRSLETQLGLLRDQNRIAEAKKVSTSFEAFLNNISGRGNLDLRTMYWIATTFRNMGQGLDKGGPSKDKDVIKYYGKAADTYQKVLDQIDTLVKDPDKKALVEMSARIRLAETLRRSGKGQQALEILVEVLRKKAQSLEGQVEAASCYQALGEEDPENFVHAIHGGYREKIGDEEANVVWGWLRLDRVLSRSNNPNFIKIMHQAKFNVAKCIYDRAMMLSGDKKLKELDKAGANVLHAHKSFPDMPEEYLDRYDDMLKKINRELGRDPVSLKKASGRDNRSAAR